MVDAPVWVSDWVHQCCGETRRLGQWVDVGLTFAGETVPATGPDSVEVLSGDRVRIVGQAAGQAGLDEGHTEGTRIASGSIRSAIAGDAPGAGHMLPARRR